MTPEEARAQLDAERNGHSANGKPSERERVPFPEPVIASALPRIDYGELAIWDGFLYRGRTSLLWSLPKVGKTTLLAHLLRAMRAANVSESFLGRRVRRGRALYVSEENAGDWGNRVARLGIGDHVAFLPRPIPAVDVHPRLIWCDLVDHLAALTARDNYDLVVIDTIGYAWGVDDENSAPHVQAALNHLTGRFPDAALLLDHHSRKSGGEEGTGARGSGALLGYVDVSIELRRTVPQDPADCRRSLLVNSRIPDAPAETIVRLTEDGEMEPAGSRQDARQEAQRRRDADKYAGEEARFLEALDTLDPRREGVTVRAVRDAMCCSGERCSAARVRLRLRGVIEDVPITVAGGKGAVNRAVGVRRTDGDG